MQFCLNVIHASQLLFNRFQHVPSLPPLIVLYFLPFLPSLSPCSGSGISLLILKQRWISSMQFQSLDEISAGNVYIFNNSGLCFYNTVNWTSLFRTPSQKVLIRNNRDPKECSTYDVKCRLSLSCASCHVTLVL